MEVHYFFYIPYILLFDIILYRIFVLEKTVFPHEEFLATLLMGDMLSKTLLMFGELKSPYSFILTENIVVNIILLKFVFGYFVASSEYFGVALGYNTFFFHYLV